MDFAITMDIYRYYGIYFVNRTVFSVSLINSQVLLKGCETKGYVILSAAKAEILQRIHKPVWKDRTLVSKTTWIGSLDCMQYYATVAAGGTDATDENIMWLTVDNIQEKEVTIRGCHLSRFADTNKVERKFNYGEDRHVPLLGL